jgi:magnesium chelatase accessory protein
MAPASARAASAVSDEAAAERPSARAAAFEDRPAAPARRREMVGGLVFERDGRDWPNREASRFISAGGVRFHFQVAGDGPPLLLLHGTGASTHSWRALLPRLAEHFTVIAPDLPGHGFTSMPAPERLSLPAMADAVSALLRTLELDPEIVVGHSAGAAVLVRMALDGRIAPKAIVSLAGALLPLGGFAGQMFSPIAKLMALNPVVPQLFAWRASNPAVIERLLDQTGSRIDPAGAAIYARLARTRGHVAGALGMMANWDLKSLEADLPRLAVPLVLVAGGTDRMVRAEVAYDVRRRLPTAEVVMLRGLGHLAHEEKPELIAAIIERAAGLAPVELAPAGGA